jgi:hypothetical protein
MANDTPSGGFLARLFARIGRGLFPSQEKQYRALRRELEELRSATSRISARVDALQATRKQLDQVLANQKNDEKFRQIFRRQLTSLIRAQYLPTDIPAPLALQARRFRLRSQNEEDGIILALLQATGIGERRFVEIGAGGTGGNAATLAHDMGWTGLMVDASLGAFRAATHEYRGVPTVTIVNQRVTADNVNELLREHGLTGDVDLVSIDVDSIDYWIFDALNACTPRVVVLEYNAHFGPTRAVTLPNADLPPQAPPTYWGASLAALHKAATRKGYRLVLCEEAGVNAFFVREGLAKDVVGLTPAQAYRPFRYRLKPTERPLSPKDVFRAIEQAGLPLIDV